MYILVTPPLNDRQKEKLKNAAPGHEMIFCEKQDVTSEMLEKAEIILGNLESPAQLKTCRNLKWIQLNNAGTEGYCEPGILPKGAVLTNASGAYGLAISEHMIGCLFELRKKLHLYGRNQLSHLWQNEGFVEVIEGSRVLVVGLGDIGTEFGRKMKALGCVVKGIRRHMGDAPKWLDGLYPMEELDRLLPEADVVAFSLPGNPSTYHVLDERRIGLLKSSAVILNVGRGTAIDTEALCDALYRGKIAGAALDVTDPEPLPADHPLWDAPNAVITPHISGGFSLPETLEQIVDLFAQNLCRFGEGKPLLNEVDLRTGYRVEETRA